MRGVLVVSLGDRLRSYIFAEIEVAREVDRLLRERGVVSGAYVVPLHGQMTGNNVHTLVLDIERALSSSSDDK